MKLTPAAVATRVVSNALVPFVNALVMIPAAFVYTWFTMLVVGAAVPAWGWGYWHTMFPYGIVVTAIVALETPPDTQKVYSCESD